MFDWAKIMNELPGATVELSGVEGLAAEDRQKEEAGWIWFSVFTPSKSMGGAPFLGRLG